MSINTIGTAQRVRPSKTPRKLQLKTNQNKTKYAINFEDDSTLLARSVPEVTEYTTLIAESDTIFKVLEYDWKYMREHGTLRNENGIIVLPPSKGHGCSGENLAKTSMLSN